jgi:F1F0 ATPase subunit 2
MSDPLSIGTGLGAGLLLGGGFFAGLWWTTRRGLSSPRAALWFGASYLVRVGLLATGLYILAHGNGTRGVAACIGVIIARVAVARFRVTPSAAGTAGGNVP